MSSQIQKTYSSIAKASINQVDDITDENVFKDITSDQNKKILSKTMGHKKKKNKFVQTNNELVKTTHNIDEQTQTDDDNDNDNDEPIELNKKVQSKDKTTMTQNNNEHVEQNINDAVKAEKKPAKQNPPKDISSCKTVLEKLELCKNDPSKVEYIETDSAFGKNTTLNSIKKKTQKKIIKPKQITLDSIVGINVKSNENITVSGNDILQNLNQDELMNIFKYAYANYESNIHNIEKATKIEYINYLKYVNNKFMNLVKVLSHIIDKYNMKKNNISIKNNKILSFMIEICCSTNIFKDSTGGIRFCFNSLETCTFRGNHYHDCNFTHFNYELIDLLILVCQSFSNLTKELLEINCK